MMYGHRITSGFYHLFCGCLLALACTKVVAFTGGVTTYNKPDANTVSRAQTGPAKTPELDQTYQRTMRRAQTAAAAASAVGKIVKGFAAIGTLVAIIELARDLNGIWIKDSAGDNVLQVADPNVCTTGPCFEYSVSFNGPGPWSPSKSGACNASASQFQSQYPAFSIVVDSIVGDTCFAHAVRNSTGATTGNYEQSIASRSVAPTTGSPGLTLSDAELADKLKAWPKLPDLLDQMDDKGLEIPWTGEEIEDLPSPLVLMPRTTTHPDGSKTIEQTTLTPIRGPDGKTVNWERTTTTRQVSAPDAAGNTTTTTTTSTSNGGPAEPPRDDRAECEKSPNTLGCAELDTPTEDLPKETKNVTFSLESISWGASASCPPPWPINVPMVNKSFQMSYEPFCDVATRIKPFILAGAAFVAMLIVMAGIKS